MILSRNPYVFKFSGIELDGWISQKLLQEKTAENMADREPVRFGGVVNMIRCNHASGAGHVLNHDSRITGNVLSQVTGDYPRIEIVTAARREPDDESDRFTL